MTTRTLKQLKQRHPARREDVGDLITYSPLPGAGVSLDPFLMLNHHGPQVYRAGNRGLPFGPHPHRGIETVTFIVEGDLQHRDNAGHVSAIRAGGVQWMTAGRGLMHAEESSEQFKREGGPLELLQLWINLPARHKLTDPGYVGLQADQIPALSLDGGKATLNAIAGEWPGVTGPITSITGVAMATLALKPGANVAFSIPAGRTVFLYVVRGQVEVAGETVDIFNLAELGAEGDEVALKATTDALVILGHGEPWNEPVAWHGPFVMNTQAEIHQALRDYQAGQFGPELH